MKVCTTLGPGGTVGGGLGRAARVAVASVEEGQVASWDEHDVGWDALHDQGSEGSHHARIVRFLREQGVDVVVAAGIGPGMLRTLGSMGVRAVTRANGDAKDAVLSAAGQG